MPLLYIIYYWFCFSGWMLTDTVVHILTQVVFVAGAELGLCVKVIGQLHNQEAGWKTVGASFSIIPWWRVLLTMSRQTCGLVASSATNYIRRNCRDRGEKTSHSQSIRVGETFLQRQLKGWENPCPLSCPLPEQLLLVQAEPGDLPLHRRLFWTWGPAHLDLRGFGHPHISRSNPGTSERNEN